MAGSYGHFQASGSGVSKGDLKASFVKAGFVATRISVREFFVPVVAIKSQLILISVISISLEH